MMHKPLLIVCLFFILFSSSSCYRVPDKIEPQVSYAVQDKYLKHLPPAFPSLSAQEEDQAWGKEYLIGQKFARELDLYRAVTTFKRAEFLLPPNHAERLQEIQYQILLSYYLGKRYNEVIQTFNHSTLYHARPSFLAYHDLLVILYESYLEIGDEQKAEHILRAMCQHYPETADKLVLATALIAGDLDALRQEERQNPSKTYLTDLLKTYDTKKKSISRAQTYNAFLPGMGYLYVGQKQSALTSFLLNGLFTAAAVHFFQKGNIAAGVITTSFEAGWYFGGIYGAGEAAKLYNERIYEENAYPTLNYNGLFPVLMLKYGF